MKKLLYTLPLILVLTACASHSDDINASYVSPMQYQDYSCSQIRSELMRVAHKVNETAGVQDQKASGDAWATGVSLILWPSLFFISHNDQHVQLAELKGQYDALEQVAIQKNCNVVKELNEGKKIAAQRNAAKDANAERFKKDSKLNQ